MKLLCALCSPALDYTVQPWRSAVARKCELDMSVGIRSRAPVQATQDRRTPDRVIAVLDPWPKVPYTAAGEHTVMRRVMCLQT